MTLLSDIRVCQATINTHRIAYRTPMKFGGRVVTDAVLVDVALEVESGGGQRAVGWGSMPMGNAWAWPSRQLSSEETLSAMIRLAERLARWVEHDRVAGHPLEITHQWAMHYERLACEVVQELALQEPMPRLAQLVAASPFEAALHDAYGRVHQTNSYRLLGKSYLRRDLSAFLDGSFQGEYLDQYVLADPKPRMPLYHLVGALDPLERPDIQQPIGDGLPESLDEWIVFNGLTHLKIKLAGDDLGWDVERVLAVDRVASRVQQQRGCRHWVYSLDFNERCADVQYVLEFLDQVQSRCPAAYERIQYIEQPTHRDLASHPHQTMHEAARRKPIVIDESLVDYGSLLLARQMGYTGVALKACKGHSEALLMAAAAQKFGMFLCVQDLTCVGRSFLHSASLAARIAPVAAIEGNGRQYCPAGNRTWDEQYPGMFLIRDGTVDTSCLVGPGLY